MKSSYTQIFKGLSSEHHHRHVPRCSLPKGISLAIWETWRGAATTAAPTALQASQVPGHPCGSLNWNPGKRTGAFT